jgi:DNA-binding NarL/FixJ family response regulator
VILSMYRDQSVGFFSSGELAEIEDGADTLSALVAKHAALSHTGGQVTRHPPIAELTARFRQTGAKLSTREAQICAMFVTGQCDKEVAKATGLQLSSVATYRKRAYQKMGVSDRRGLARFYDTAASR